MSKRRQSSATDAPAKKTKSVSSQFASLVDPTPRARDGEEDDNAEFTRPEDIDYGYGSDEDDRMEMKGRLRMQSGIEIEEMDEKYQGRVALSPQNSDGEDSGELEDDMEEDDSGVSGEDDEDDDDDISGDDDDEDNSDISGDDDDEEETADMKFERELAQLQKEEAEVLEGISKVKDEEVDQAVAVREQKKLWTQLLEFRISVQGCLTAASRMPKADVFAAFEEANDPQLDHRLEQVQKLAMDTVNDLRIVSSQLLEADETVAKVCEVQEPECITEPDELWEALESEHDTVKPWRQAEINKWSRKTMASKQLQGGKALQSFAKSAMEQVSEVLTDMPRLLKRTQLKRGEYKIIGESAPVVQEETESKRDGHLQQHDEEVFDDTDFYERLLQELIESGSQASLQAALTGKSAVKKTKAKVDTRASKGRKIRYQVHPKLVNFMYATGFDMPPEAEQLFSRLFGQRNET